MTKPKPKPPVDYATFCNDLLAQWADDVPLAADDTVSSPREAAKLALYRAAITREVGRVLVVVPGGEQRAITGFLDAMCEGQRLLASLRGRIEVVSAERAVVAKDAVATILLSAAAPVREMDGEEVARRVAQILVCAMHGESVDEALPIIAKLYPGEDPRAVLDHMIAVDREQAAERAAERAEDWRAAQVVPASGNLPAHAYRKPEQPILSRDDLICSDAFLQKQAQDRGLSEMRGGGPLQRRALTTSRSSQRTPPTRLFFSLPREGRDGACA